MHQHLIAESRQLVLAAMAAQAARSGGWQRHQHSCWWQSGLPASGANLVLDCGGQPQRQSLSRLSSLMRWSGGPVGWLVWPDQHPALQRRVLAAAGYRPSEPLWLGVLPSCRELAGSASPREMGVLSGPESAAYVRYLEQCHQIHQAYAQLISATFLASAQPAAFKTLAIWREGAIAAAVTAAVQRRADAAPALGHLLWLGVLPAWRRRGLARALTRQACQWLLGLGVERIHVQASPMAVGLYRSLGFTEAGELELWGWG